MQGLAEMMGTTVKNKNLEKDLGYLGIATRYCLQTRMRILTFLLDKWNTQCNRLGKNGTQGGRVQEQAITSLAELSDRFPGAYKVYCDLLRFLEQDQLVYKGKQESKEAGGDARQQPLDSTKSDVFTKGKVEATEMHSAPAAVTPWRKRALKQEEELPSAEKGSRRTKARHSGHTEIRPISTLCEDAGELEQEELWFERLEPSNADAPVGLVMTPAMPQVKPVAEELCQTTGISFGHLAPDADGLASEEYWKLSIPSSDEDTAEKEFGFENFESLWSDAEAGNQMLL